MKLNKLFLNISLIFTITLFCGIYANAEIEGIYTYSVSNDEATITDCNASASGDIVIPSSLSGYSVTSIGYNAFYGCTGLTSVTIPDSVTSIGDYAFRDCTGLTSVTIPDRVTSIGGGAFSGCSGLTSITIPDSITSIGYSAFYNCTGLTSVTIPDSVTSIGWEAFYNCTRLTSITIPDSVTSISSDAFTNTAYYNNTYNWDGGVLYAGNWVLDCNTSKSGILEIKPGCVGIGDDAFYNCKGLTSVTIPDSVTSIGSDAFRNCTGLTSITIPDSVTSIGGEAFYNCTGLTEINWNVMKISDFSEYNDIFYNAGQNGEGIKLVFGDSVERIPAYAFFGCSGLTSVTILDGVTSIGGYAFSGCTGLESVTIPDSVTSIGGYAFRYCTGLESITIPDSVTSIGYCAFYNCTGLTSITIPDSVTSIGGYAFRYCTGLTEINWNTKNVSDFRYDDCVFYNAGENGEGIKLVFGDGVERIPAYAFRYCTGLESITIPDSVTSIGDSAFEFCTGLTSVTIPDSVTSIGGEAFSDCTGLESITIPGSVTSIGGSAFSDCTGLTEINWNAKNVSDFSGYNYIFANAGQNGEGIKVVFGDSVEHIPANAFYSYSSSSSTTYSSNITSVTIPDSVKSIGKDAFTNTAYYNNTDNWDDGVLYASNWILDCDTSKSGILEIKPGCVGIAENAFYNCTNIRAVKIDTIEDWLKINFSNEYSNPTYYGVDLYIGVSKLSSDVIIPDGIKRIGKYAFYNFDQIENVSIPTSVTEIDEYAFYGCTGLTSITIPDGVTSIGEYAFYNCTGLTSVTIPDSVTSIGNYAFCYCTGLTSVTIPDSVTSIGDYAFSDCTGLTCITIPDSVTEIGQYAFSYCYSLKNAVLGSGLTVIERNTFRDNGLDVIVISSGIETINSNAFYDSDIKTVVIPKTVTSIGDYAFDRCYDLTDVYYEGTELEWLSLPIDIVGNDYLLDANIHYGEYVQLTGLDFDKTVTNILKNQNTSITPVFAPDNATIKNIYWQSSNTDIATVDENGAVTAGDTDGIAIITATSADGGHTARCIVTVGDTELKNENIVVNGKEFKDNKCNFDFDILLDNVDKTYVAVGVYGNGGKLLGINSVDCTLTNGYANVKMSVETNTAPQYFKIMLWNSITDIRPLAVPYDDML